MNDITIREHGNCLQANELSRSIYSCSMIARKLISFAATKIQEKDLSKNVYFKEIKGEMYIAALCAEFRISELIKALGLTDSGENYAIIKKAVNELRHCSVEIRENDDEFRIWNWFQYIQYSKKKDEIELHFSTEIGWALIELYDNYCSLQLKTVGEFKSFYAFRWYEIALSWMGMKGKNGNPKGCWWFQFNENEIRTMFKIDENSYKGKDGTTNFQKKVIQKPIDELNSICREFQIEVSRLKRGRNIIGYRFDCKEVVEERKKITKSTPKAEREQIRQINDEAKEIQLYANLYPEEWAAALKQATIEGQAMRPPRMAILNEYRAVELLQAQGLIVD